MPKPKDAWISLPDGNEVHEWMPSCEGTRLYVMPTFVAHVPLHSFSIEAFNEVNLSIPQCWQTHPLRSGWKMRSSSGTYNLKDYVAYIQKYATMRELQNALLAQPEPVTKVVRVPKSSPTSSNSEHLLSPCLSTSSAASVLKRHDQLDHCQNKTLSSIENNSKSQHVQAEKCASSVSIMSATKVNTDDDWEEPNSCKRFKQIKSEKSKPASAKLSLSSSFSSVRESASEEIVKNTSFPGSLCTTTITSSNSLVTNTSMYRQDTEGTCASDVVPSVISVPLSISAFNQSSSRHNNFSLPQDTSNQSSKTMSSNINSRCLNKEHQAGNITKTDKTQIKSDPSAVTGIVQPMGSLHHQSVENEDPTSSSLPSVWTTPNGRKVILPFQLKNYNWHGRVLSMDDYIQLARPIRHVRFGTNIDLAEHSAFHKQLSEIKQVIPEHLQPSSSHSMLSHLWSISGINTPQMYMKVRGCTTPAHQENNNFISININLGPDACVWYYVSMGDVEHIKKMCKERNIRFTKDAFWPDPTELRNQGIAVSQYIQESGCAVLVPPGTLHWVRALGTCVNISWNLAPYTLFQFKATMNANFHLVPMQALTRLVLIHSPPKDEKLRHVMASSLQKIIEHDERFCESCSLPGIKYDYAHQICKQCSAEIFNIFFATSPDTLYCLDCREALTKKIIRRIKNTQLQQITRDTIIKVMPRSSFFNRERPEQLFRSFGYFFDFEELKELVKQVFNSCQQPNAPEIGNSSSQHQSTVATEAFRLVKNKTETSLPSLDTPFVSDESKLQPGPLRELKTDVDLEDKSRLNEENKQQDDTQTTTANVSSAKKSEFKLDQDARDSTTESMYSTYDFKRTPNRLQQEVDLTSIPCGQQQTPQQRLKQDSPRKEEFQQQPQGTRNKGVRVLQLRQETRSLLLNIVNLMKQNGSQPLNTMKEHELDSVMNSERYVHCLLRQVVLELEPSTNKHKDLRGNHAAHPPNLKDSRTQTNLMTGNYTKFSEILDLLAHFEFDQNHVAAIVTLLALGITPEHALRLYRLQQMLPSEYKPYREHEHTSPRHLQRLQQELSHKRSQQNHLYEHNQNQPQHQPERDLRNMGQFHRGDSERSTPFTLKQHPSSIHWSDTLQQQKQYTSVPLLYSQQSSSSAFITQQGFDANPTPFVPSTRIGGSTQKEMVRERLASPQNQGVGQWELNHSSHIDSSLYARKTNIISTTKTPYRKAQLHSLESFDENELSAKTRAGSHTVHPTLSHSLQLSQRMFSSAKPDQST